ncbi:hypothetical protein CYJ76_08890 [Kytococcus schroeteri]|uniref:DUF6318 domain-containing protein n=2 Tax=Kytococcus schroeteri TaxID=138300 RepID=A0A2I1P976_9MICO|nr:DUF6318 family protein [Kytococcus schroeteri]PKZ41161.1 hypothetical protein CYJ76_08890 [Kytococcus schroeteri]
MPAAAKENTAEGAEAFARWYIETLSYLYEHPKAGVLDKYAGEDCNTCARHVRVVQQSAEQNAQADKVVYEVLGAGEPHSMGDGYEITVAFRQNASVIRDETGSVVGKTTELPEVGYVFRLTYDKGWTIEKMHPNDAPYYEPDAS